MPTSTTSGGSVRSGKPGVKPSNEPAEHEQDRVGNPQRIGEQQKRRCRHEQQQQL